MRLTRLFRDHSASAEIPAGCRVYAVGDIHGEFALFRELLTLIESDIAARGPARTSLVLLGDLIDRGPESARLLRALGRHRVSSRFVILKGNHEAALVHALAGNTDAMQLWLTHGGVATLRSFGVAEHLIDRDNMEAMIRITRDTIPVDLENWLDRLPLFQRIGDYYFVHAGVRPGVKLSSQKESDLLWIREEFTESEEPHGAIIVHGHTVYEDGVKFTANRIGVDTGAYRTGKLSAVGLQGKDQWALTTRSLPSNLSGLVPGIDRGYPWQGVGGLKTGALDE